MRCDSRAARRGEGRAQLLASSSRSRGVGGERGARLVAGSVPGAPRVSPGPGSPWGPVVKPASLLRSGPRFPHVIKSPEPRLFVPQPQRRLSLPFCGCMCARTYMRLNSIFGQQARRYDRKILKQNLLQDVWAVCKPDGGLAACRERGIAEALFPLVRSFLCPAAWIRGGAVRLRRGGSGGAGVVGGVQVPRCLQRLRNLGRGSWVCKPS